MSTMMLKDILIGARQESYRMRHFYVGAEHLFIALLDNKGSLAGNICQEHGLTPAYVIDAIRRKVGKGGKHRLWAGVPNTPRADVLLGIGNDLALENGREEINERDLLVAIFEERENIPVRVLNALGISDLDQLAETARTMVIQKDSQRPFVKVDFGPSFDRDNELPKDQLLLLRRIFDNYSEIRIERPLPVSYDDAVSLVVKPVGSDNEVLSVVKTNRIDMIIDESRRYETFVKATLPSVSASIDGKPVAPEASNLAGIKYTLPDDVDAPQDLLAMVATWDSDQLGTWLQGTLLPVFGRQWWQQSKPYRFQIWREYDWMLPPILTLDLIRDKKTPPEIKSIKMPIEGSKIHDLAPSEVVSIENFIVEQVYPERNMIQLAAGHGTDAIKAYKIEIYGIDLSSSTYYRGEVVEAITGRVRNTRKEQFLQMIRSLSPTFDSTASHLPIPDSEEKQLPNPIFAYKDFLNTSFLGALSTVHGNFHPGNIMVGANSNALVFDFAHVRGGHTLFDWATLEMSFLSSAIMPGVGESWADAFTLTQKLMTMNDGLSLSEISPDSEGVLAPVVKIREVIKQLLLAEDDWSEYFIALAFCSLRDFSWTKLSSGSRRMAFLVAALAFHELETRFPIGGRES
jgi:hypothetical protein